MEEESRQNLMMQFGMFEKRIQELQQQIEAVERQRLDLQTLSFGMEDLVNGKDKEIFSPVGAGIFIKSKIISDSLIVDIGKGNFVKKTIPETKELLEEQVSRLAQIKKELENELERTGQELTEMFQKVQGGHSCNCVEHGEDSDKECNCEDHSCGDDCKCK